MDAVGEVIDRRDVGNGTLFSIRAPQEVARYLVPKGSITINGVSLTVNTVSDRPPVSDFTVMIVPYTAEKTTLMDLRPGVRVNLEADIIGKYVATYFPMMSASRLTLTPGRRSISVVFSAV